MTLTWRQKSTLILAALGLSALTACGSGTQKSRVAAGPVVALASGPVSAACNRSPRKGANARLCGCAQAVANRRLNDGDQRLAATFFVDPQLAQDIRQSDRASHEAFWKRYKDFIAETERYCAATI